MNTIYKRALICLFLFIVSATTLSQWQRTNGPEGISINSLLNVGGTLYAGTATEGVYASTNGGVNWFPRNSGIETRGVVSLASGPGYLFAGTAGYGVYRSTDGGQTWLPPSNGNNFYVSSLVVKDSYVFAGTQGVYRSTDNGETWTNVIFATGLFSAMCVAANKIFASEYNYTFVSTNNGSNWSYVNDLTGSAGYSLYYDGNFIYSGGVNKIYRSSDQGNSFNLISINFNFSHVNINSITSIGTILFAGTSFDGVYKSTNNGLAWTSAKTGMGPKNIRALAVSGSSFLIAGSRYEGVYRSSNEGSTWTKSVAGFPAGSTVSGLYTDGSTVYAGTYDGLFESMDNGLTWSKLTSTIDTVNYSHIRGICIKDNILFIATIFYLRSTVYRSTDKGVTWERSGNGFPSDLAFINSLVVSNNNILAATSKGVYYSPNNGDSWLHANAPDQYLLNVANSGAYAYAPYGTLGSIYRSVDNGVNWSLVAFTGINYTTISAKDNFVSAGSFFSGAQISTNFGTLWSHASGIPGNADVFSVYHVPNSDMVLAAAYLNPNFIYASFNNGISYSPYSGGLGPNAIAEWFTATDSFLIAGTSYNGVWRRLRPALVSVSQQNQNVPSDFLLEQNYPNPFNPETKIVYSIPNPGFVSLKVYDIVGHEVATLVEEVKQPGKYSVIWDAGRFASGIYLYKLSSGGFTSTKKMTLIK